MSVVINTNYAATVASNNLSASSTMLQRSLNRLSSGSKIVNPSDDAGGLAVSMKLTSAARRQGAVQANIGNAVSFLQTQDGALKVAGKILDRVSELKTLASDETKNSNDKANYETEFTELKKQLVAIKGEKFNSVELFNSTANALSVKVTEDLATNSAVSLAGRDLGGTAGIGSLLDVVSAASAASAASTTSTASQASVASQASSASVAAAGTNASVASVASSASAASAASAGSQGSTASTAAVSGSTKTLAGLTLDTIKTAIEHVATFRAANGAEQSRLGFANELLTVNKANLEAANSRITDVDVAEESTQLARWNILVQSGTAMLSQANQSAQVALKLIG